MSWLIVGANGQLGSALVDELGKRNFDFSASNSAKLDITNKFSVREYFKSVQPKVIINAAAYTNVDGAENNRALAWTVNADGASNLALAARECGALFAQISTDYVFSGKVHSPHEVLEPTAPESVYGESKAEGERLVSEVYADGTYIFRTAWLYSANRRNFAKTLTRKAIRAEGATVVNDQRGQPTFAGDLAEKIVNTVELKLPLGIYHATNSGDVTWFDFAKEIYRLAGADQSLVFPSASDSYPQVAKRPEYSVLSHRRWIEVGIEPMRDWKLALEEAMPAIISAVKAEE